MPGISVAVLCSRAPFKQLWCRVAHCGHIACWPAVLHWPTLPHRAAVHCVAGFRLFGVAEGSGAWWVRGMLRAADSHGISAKFR